MGLEKVEEGVLCRHGTTTIGELDTSSINFNNFLVLGVFTKPIQKLISGSVFSFRRLDWTRSVTKPEAAVVASRLLVYWCWCTHYQTWRLGCRKALCLPCYLSEFSKCDKFCTSDFETQNVWSIDHYNMVFTSSGGNCLPISYRRFVHGGLCKAFWIKLISDYIPFVYVILDIIRIPPILKNSWSTGSLSRASTWIPRTAPSSLSCIDTGADWLKTYITLIIEISQVQPGLNSHYRTKFTYLVVSSSELRILYISLF